MTAVEPVQRPHRLASPRRPSAAPRTAPRDTPYIGLVTRAIAFVIDAVVIDLVAVVTVAVVALVATVIPGRYGVHAWELAVGAGLFVLWVAGYFTTFWTATGQTPGNRVMQIRVVRADGARLRPHQALLRLAGVMLSFPLLAGFVPILFNDRRRGLADAVADTVVVTADPDQ